MKVIVSESDKKHIMSLYGINEQSGAYKPTKEDLSYFNYTDTFPNLKANDRRDWIEKAAIYLGYQLELIKSQKGWGSQPCNACSTTISGSLSTDIKNNKICLNSNLLAKTWKCPEGMSFYSVMARDYNTTDWRTMLSLVKSSPKKETSSIVDTHTMMTILQIGTAFIPLVGPFISAGIGLADAAIYYNEGDKKTAGLVGMFSIIPGIGGLASKMGLGKIGAKTMAEICRKLGAGSKLTPIESQIVNKVAKNKQLLQSEIDKLSKIGIKNTEMAKQGAKSQLKKQAIKQNVVKTAKPIVGYGAAGAGYSEIYDKTNTQNQNVDFDKIDLEKISQANKDAALNVEF